MESPWAFCSGVIAIRVHFITNYGIVQYLLLISRVFFVEMAVYGKTGVVSLLTSAAKRAKVRSTFETSE